MRRAIASTVVRGLQAGGTASSSGVALRALSTQAPITATLFPGDGEGMLQPENPHAGPPLLVDYRRRRRRSLPAGGRVAAAAAAGQPAMQG